MAYLQSMRGDYLSGYRGDPSIFSTIGNVLRRVGSTALGAAGQVVPGPGGFVARQASRALAPRRPQPALGGGGQRFPGGLSVPRFGPGGTTKKGLPPALGGRKRRRMNPGNARALRRAIRRQDAFVKLARGALKGTNYTIVTRSSRSRPRSVTVRESGPGGVTVGR